MFSLYRTRTIKLSTWFAFCELDHSISSSNIYPGLSHCSEAVNPVSHNNANAKHPKATGCSMVCWPKQGHCRTFGLIWNDLSWVSCSETTRLCTLNWWNVTKCKKKKLHLTDLSVVSIVQCLILWLCYCSHFSYQNSEALSMQCCEDGQTVWKYYHTRGIAPLSLSITNNDQREHCPSCRTWNQLCTL